MTQPSPTGQTLSHSLLNVILVLVEAVFTLLLRFDANLRQAAYPLAKQDTLVCIRTYLPHTQIYATFDYKGILLDDEMPIGKTEADVIINTYSFQLFGAVVGSQPHQVDALQIRGEPDKVLLVKDFLLQVGIARLVHNLLQKFGGKPKPVNTEESRTQRLSALKQELEQKKGENDALVIANQRLSVQLQEAQGKAKSMTTLSIVLAVAMLLAVIANFIW